MSWKGLRQSSQSMHRLTRLRERGKHTDVIKSNHRLRDSQVPIKIEKEQMLRNLFASDALR